MDKEKFLKPGERLDDLRYGNLHLIQDPNHYCFTTDAVLLANFAKTRPLQRVVDLCSGSGVVGILMQAKTNAKSLVLVELQEKLADMSKRSVELNGLKNTTVINAPLQNVCEIIGKENFDVVLCNPPYKKENSSILNENLEIAICKHEIKVTLEEIILEASRLLKFGGYFYTINKEERLTDLIVLLRKYALEPKEISVVPSKKGSPLILIKAKKGGKSGVKITQTLVPLQ